MRIVRRIVVALLAIILPLLLLLTALDFGIIRTAGNPGKVEKIIADSGVYQNIIPATLEQASQQSGQSSVSLIDPAVKKVATETLTPQFLQTSTESVINGIYRWLDGTVPRPDFKIDLSGKKTEFATLVADHAKQVAAKLPRCSLAESEKLVRQSNNFNVFGAKCLPMELAPKTIAANVKRELLNNKDFLKDPVITADNLKNTDARQSVFDKYRQVPNYYRWVKRTPVILSLLTLLVAAGIVFISSSRRKGLRRVGIIMVVVSVLMLVLALGLNYGINQKALPRLNIDNKVLQGDVKSLITDIAQAISQNYWLFGGIYAVLGATGIIVAWKYHRAPASANDSPPAERPMASDSKTKKAPETAKPKSGKPKSKPKRTIKIQ